MKKEISKKYDRIAKKYSKQIYDNFWNNILEYGPTIREINKLNLKGKKVLDVGCGSGRYTKIILEKGGKVWGIDSSKKMLEIAKQDIENVEFKLGNACKTKYKSGFFDVIFSGLVLEYVNRDKFFKEMNRILKKNGTVLFSMHVPYTELGKRLIEREDTFKFENYFNEGKFYKRWPRFKARMCFRHVTMQTAIRAILKNGFIIEDYIDMKPPGWSRRKHRKDYEIVTRLPPFCIMKIRKK